MEGSLPDITNARKGQLLVINNGSINGTCKGAIMSLLLDTGHEFEEGSIDQYYILPEMNNKAI